jgi:hypothetical protein
MGCFAIYSDFELFTFSYLLMHKYESFVKEIFDWAIIGKGTIVLRTLSIRGTKDFQQAR